MNEFKKTYQKQKTMRKEMKKIDMFSVSEDIPKDSIGDDFIMLDDISKAPFFEYPAKIDFAIIDRKSTRLNSSH